MNKSENDSLKKQVIDAYVRIRKIDHTIPDEILDFMKDAAIEKLSQLDDEIKLLSKHRS